MFAYIKGKLEIKHNDYVVVEANGIGYKILTSVSTVNAAGAIGEEVKLYTYLYVREDIMSLYGFFTQEEMNIFELLISVSGVGPKAAIALLSSVSPSELSLAVIMNDSKTLTKAQGIGMKMAQRIVLELKDKIKKEQITKELSDIEATPCSSDSSRINEAVSALMVLGYSQIESNKAVWAVYSDELNLEEIIRLALKGMER